MASLLSNTRKVIQRAVAVDDDPIVNILSTGTRRQRAIIVNMGTSEVYLGDSGVTDTDGLPWNPDDGPLVLDGHVGALYAVCSSGESATLRVLEFIE
jgi:hypothetical protein